MQLVKKNWLKIAKEGGNFDLVHVEHLRGTHYGLALKRWLEIITDTYQMNKIPIVWDSVDCISLLFERTAHSSRSRFGLLAAQFDLPRTRRYEGWLVQQFDHTLITAEADRQALASLYYETCSKRTRNI